MRPGTILIAVLHLTWASQFAFADSIAFLDTKTLKALSHVRSKSAQPRASESGRSSTCSTTSLGADLRSEHGDLSETDVARAWIAFLDEIEAVQTEQMA